MSELVVGYLELLPAAFLAMTAVGLEQSRLGDGRPLHLLDCAAAVAVAGTAPLGVACLLGAANVLPARVTSCCGAQAASASETSEREPRPQRSASPSRASRARP